MREIEIKARIKFIDTIVTRLEKSGTTLSEPLLQRDEVFGLPGVPGDAENCSPWLRIRTESQKGKTRIIYTLKKSITNQLDSIEHETEVADPNELRQIILHSGFVPYVDVVKVRRKGKLGDIEICIDEVEGLGCFIEAEKLTSDDADYDVVTKELWAVLNSLGIESDSEITDGYDTMIKRQQTGAA